MGQDQISPCIEKKFEETNFLELIETSGPEVICNRKIITRISVIKCQLHWE